MIDVGTEVERVKGGPGYTGMTGVVVEKISSGRLRVKWEGKNGQRGKRTWVQPDVVKVKPKATA